MTYGNEQIRDLPLILCPSLTILGSAALHISPSSMQNHGREESSVKPRERAVEACNEPPCQSLDKRQQGKAKSL